MSSGNSEITIPLLVLGEVRICRTESSAPSMHVMLYHYQQQATPPLLVLQLAVEFPDRRVVCTAAMPMGGHAHYDGG